MIAGLLHTVPALAPTFDALVAEAVPSAQREHVVDAWMLETAIAEGVTSAVRERVASHLRHLAESGADAVLVTCSSIGEAAEDAAADLDIPVIRVDAPMAAEAARAAGRAGTDRARIAVLATNTATLGPTTRLIQREAAAQGVDAVVTATVVEGAARARAVGDQDTHDRLIAEAVRKAAVASGGEEPAVVLVLAQASMAHAAESAGVDIPVLTSPAGGVARLVEALTPSDPGTPAASADRRASPGSDGTSRGKAPTS
ncbi:aspartate/glutamate racemase family protein [Leifsonia sp. 2MCAF36]|uniref:aspartate/glutamate racemase family protein n=1 Tax=Leifsonia sp. 2MCAF36 TaxID=3232988 RepID=UPI003F9A969C